MTADVFDNMKNFVEGAKFKKATLTFLAHKIPEKSIEDLRNIFITVDKNGDGRI